MEVAAYVNLVIMFNVFKHVDGREEREELEELAGAVWAATEMLLGVLKERVVLTLKGRWAGASPWLVCEEDGGLHRMLDMLKLAVLKSRNLREMNLRDAVQSLLERGESADQLERRLVASKRRRESLVVLVGVDNLDLLVGVGAFTNLKHLEVRVEGSWDAQEQDGILAATGEKLSEFVVNSAPKLSVIKVILREWDGSPPEINSFVKVDGWVKQRTGEECVVYKRE
jgi:hypothetical protein